MLIKDMKSGNFLQYIEAGNLQVSRYFKNPEWSVSLFVCSSICLLFLIIIKCYLFSPDIAGQSIIIKECERIRGEMLN